MKRYTKKINELIYTYRYDLFSGIFMLSFILWTFEPIFSKGHIVFSDIAFGYESNRYLTEIFGLWNERWSTSTLLNIPRLLYILPFWLLSMVFGGSGPFLIKSFILGLITISAGSMYLFSKRVVSLYFHKEFDFYKVFALVTGSLYYALNPWVIFRIQHIYLLCGYSLFPLLLRLFFDIFDPKFQAQVIDNYDISRVVPYRKNIREMAVFALLYSISAGAIHYFFYGAIYFSVIGGLILIKNGIRLLPDLSKLGGFVKNMAMKLGILILFFSLTSFYWLGNYVLSILTRSQASQHNINTVDTMSLFSRNSTFTNILYLDSYWWPMFDMTKLPLSFYIGGGILLLFILHAMIFRSYRYHIILFFTVLSVIFIVASTGTKVETLAPIFVLFVTKTPVIGSIFRDPNKLVGLLAVGFSLLLTFGVEQVLIRFRDSYRSYLTKGIIILTTLFSLWYYIEPFKLQFIDGFYSPVEIPQEMKEVQDKFYDGGEFSRVLFLPVADNMIQPHTGVATPKWNKNPNLEGFVKATGDIHIYSSRKNTIFHHEGNIVGITYFLNYIQHLMDRGLSRNMGKLLKAFPVDEVAYHDEYLGKERRQDFNLKLLSEQGEMEKHYENDIYHLYKLKDPRGYMEAYGNKIYTPYGFSKLETYLSTDRMEIRDIPVIFTNQRIDGEMVFEGTRDDYVETETFNDLLLSTLPEEYYAFPFEAIEGANVFMNWGKVLIKNSDWTWYLNSQGIDNFPFDFDMERGMAATFSTSRLDVPPYKFKDLRGRIIADFDSFLRTNKFFKADNPHLFSVQANPKKATNKIPVLRGEIIKGDPKSIWQVAKSGLIKAKENNPYQFNLLISGRGTNKLHVKVRFFDRDLNEIGVSYVVAPKDEFFFDEMNFYGEYISPPKSEYMRLDLLSFQNNKQKNYWWIHDLYIKDLEEYKGENYFHLELPGREGERGSLYIRTLISKAGGEIQLENGDELIDVDTYSKDLNRLQWIDLGSTTLDSDKLTIYNRKGFNAINALVFIPEGEKRRVEFPVRRLIKDSTLFMSLEAEDAFDYEGNIQSERRYPLLSGGRGIRSQEGRLSKRVEILKDTDYEILLGMEAVPEHDGTLTVTLRDSEKKIVKREIFTPEASETSIAEEKDEEESVESVVIPDYLYENFPRRYLKLPDTLNHYSRRRRNIRELKVGEYELEISFNSKAPSMTTLEDMHKFDPAEIMEPEFFEDIFQEDCSECEFIDEAMMEDEIIGVPDDSNGDKLQKILNIRYDPTCSCDWYVYASKMMPIEPIKEYLISYDARSETVDKRHGKVLFLDEKRDVVDVQYIYEVEEEFKGRWNSYEQILSPPEGASFMQLQIWCRGDKEEEGLFQMKNLNILPYDQLILLDNITLREKKIDQEESYFFPADTGVEVSYRRIDSMKREFQVVNPLNKRVMISYGESPNPLWRETIGGERVDKVMNGVGAYFITEESGRGEVSILLRKVYYLGILLLIVSLLTYGGYRVLLHRRSQKEKFRREEKDGSDSCGNK
ncbi:MFS transporter [Propionigenium maris DSM 9537]|uniref:MFS transporter n=1 Tax=Propionigenium maris DSM 9537 TaxID=1123000 RepID=A0A9W6GGJ0_9FUSO|nr:hypothetical protein [Propionigenium maris]GLI54849.1 MFS transporter [Propionigenium maris DSM 9537]